MGISGVTSVAIGGGMGDRWDLTDLVAERRVAGGAFDLMIRHMLSVEGLGGVFGDEDFRFVVALQALPLRDMGIPLDHTEMALLAGDPPFNIFPMIEIPALDIDIAFGGDVAGGAASHRTRDAVILSLRAGLVIMADKTVDLMNGEMGSLNDLGMAGGAAEFHPPSQFLKVFSMGEGHILIDHVSLEILDLMTPLLEATRIADLGMGLRGFLSGDEVSQ
jgi:hypothetical protein